MIRRTVQVRGVRLSGSDYSGRTVTPTQPSPIEGEGFRWGRTGSIGPPAPRLLPEMRHDLLGEHPHVVDLPVEVAGFGAEPEP